MPAPKVFISCSHDSEQHKDWVGKEGVSFLVAESVRAKRRRCRSPLPICNSAKNSTKFLHIDPSEIRTQSIRHPHIIGTL
jgi:hypothetical protein